MISTRVIFFVLKIIFFHYYISSFYLLTLVYQIALTCYCNMEKPTKPLYPALWMPNPKLPMSIPKLWNSILQLPMSIPELWNSILQLPMSIPELWNSILQLPMSIPELWNSILQLPMSILQPSISIPAVQFSDSLKLQNRFYISPRHH